MPEYSLQGKFMQEIFPLILCVELCCGTRDDGSEQLLSEFTTSGDKYSTAYSFGTTSEHLRLLRRVTFHRTDLMPFEVEGLDLSDAMCSAMIYYNSHINN